MTTRPTLIALTLAALLLSGCQTPTAAYLRDRVFPQQMAIKVAASPVLLPMYIVATGLDIVIVNPLRGMSNVPTHVGYVWGWANEEPWVGYGLLMPAKLVAMPVTAVGSTIFSEQFGFTEGGGGRPSPIGSRER